MTNTRDDTTPSPRSGPGPKRPLVFGGLITALALLASGCAGIKDSYPAVAEAQQRQAAEAANTAATTEPVDSPTTYLRLVEQMQREGMWFASLAHIDALEQRWGVSPESNRMRGDALRNTDQLALSESIYKRLLGTPLEGAGYHGLGLLAGARGNYADAVQFLKQAQRRSPTDALLLSDLGYANLRAGFLNDARLPLMQALQLKPDNAQAQANLALYLEMSQQSEQSTALMDAHRMPAAMRAGIREAAQRMNGSVAPAGRATTGDASGDGGAPLALKASRWPGMRGATSTSSSPPSPSPPVSAASLPETATQGTP